MANNIDFIVKNSIQTGSPILPQFGGTGVANSSGNTLTLSGGALTITLSGATNVTFPTSGTVLTSSNVSSYGVSSIAGTANQVVASASTGAVTLSLPQSINSGAAPVFAGTNFTGIPNGALTNSTVTVTAGTGVSVTGSPVALGGTVTVSNTGVTSFNTRTGVVALTSSDVTSALTYTPISNAGGAVSGSLTFSAGTVTGLASPSNASDAATKNYVDSVAAGLTPKAAVIAATTAALTVTQSGSGVGATLTNAGTQAAFAVDGQSLTSGQRVLIKNQATGSQNGIYSVTTVGSGSSNWVLTRTTDFDGSPANEVASGDTVFVETGTSQATTFWVLTTADPITVDTTALVFTQYGGPGSYSAGTGLTLTGTVFSLPSVGTAGTYTSVTTDGQGRVTAGTNPGYITGNQTVTLSGDVTGSGATAITTTLATVNSNVGSFGDSTHVAAHTVNAKGLVTAASSIAIAFPVTSVFGRTGAVVSATSDYAFSQISGSLAATQLPAFTGDVTSPAGSSVNTLATVNSNVGTFNNVTINAKGLATAGSNVSYLTANQTITASGDATGSGTTALALTLATVNSNVGSFTNANITVNAKGLITAAANGTGPSLTSTYVGYGSGSNLLTGDASLTYSPTGFAGSYPALSMTNATYNVISSATGSYLLLASGGTYLANTTSATISLTSTAGAAGGAVAIIAGGGSSSGSVGGAVTVTAGAGAATGTAGGGAVNFNGGTGGAAGGTGGGLTMQAGAAGANANGGGSINFTAGNGLTTGAGGNVILKTGISPSGTSGSIQFNTGTTASTAAMSIGPTGSVSIAAPSTLTALTVNGNSSASAIFVQGTTTTSLSFGTLIFAGTNSSDAGLRVYNAAGTVQQFIVNGAGNTILNPQDNLSNAGSVSTGTVTVNCNTNNVEQITLAASGLTVNITNIAQTTNTTQTLTVVFVQDSTGSRTLPSFQLNGTATTSTTLKWDNGAVPVLTTTAGKTDILQFFAVNVGGTITLFGAQVIGNA